MSMVNSQMMMTCGAGDADADMENSSQPGNQKDAPTRRQLPTGDLLPTIVVQYCHDSRIMWSRDLRDVDDDLESQYLAAKGDQLQFALDVPGKGNVEGTLWCGSTVSPVPKTFSPIYSGSFPLPWLPWSSQLA